MAGGHSEHFQIPKCELMQHVVPSVCTLGAPMQWSMDIMEHVHVTEIKVPVHAGNNQNYYTQIAHHLDHSEKCFRFDLATRIASSHHHSENSDEPMLCFITPPSAKLSITFRLLVHSPTRCGPIWQILGVYLHHILLPYTSLLNHITGLLLTRLLSYPRI